MKLRGISNEQVSCPRTDQCLGNQGLDDPYLISSELKALAGPTFVMF